MQSQDTIRRLLLRNTVSHWQQYKEDNQKHWKECVVIQAKLNHLCLKRTLRYWFKWRTQKYHNKHSIEYTNNTLDAIRIISIKRCIKYWNCYTHSVYKSQKQCIRASAYYNIKQQTKCILDWNQITQRKRNINIIFNQFKKKLKDKVITNCFNRWKKQKQIENILLRATVLWNKYSNRLYIIRSYNHWKDLHHRFKHKKGIADIFYEYKMKKIIFNAFKMNMINNEKCKEKLNQVILTRCDARYLMKNELKVAYISWKNKIKQMNTIKYNIQNDIKINVLIMWQRSTMKQQRLQYFAEKIYSKHHILELKRICMEWKEMTRRKEQSEAFLVSSCFRFWYKVSKKHGVTHLKYIILTDWLHERQLKNVWFHWYLQSLYEIEIRDKTEISVNFYEYKTKSFLFIKWKQIKINNKKERKLSKKLKNIYKKSVKRKVFNDWYLLYKMNEIAFRFLMLNYVKYWQNKMESAKYKRFNEYKSRLFALKMYFNRWLIRYEPFKIGREYELQITMSIKPYIDSVTKQRAFRLLYYSFKTWFIHKKEKEIKDIVFNKWRRRYFDENKRKSIYYWNKSIVTSIIGNITSMHKSLDHIQVSLKQLFKQKLQFQQKCKQWIQKQQNKDPKKELKQLEIDINQYFNDKHKRKQQIISILRDITTLYSYFNKTTFN